MNTGLAASSGTRVPGYGAFELKASYQRNLGLAILISSAFLFVFAAFMSIFSTQTPEQLQAPRVLVITDLLEIGAPPQIVEQEKPAIHIDLPQILAGGKVGIPEPVPEEQAEPEATILSQNQLEALDNLENKGVLTDDVDSIVFESSPKAVPQRAEFIPYSQAPVAINADKVPLKYPELARRAGIEGKVLVAALVDKNGNVKDAYIRLESGANAGFEEAALKQAFKLKYVPALSNGVPVQVWIIYRVNFKL